MKWLILLLICGNCHADCRMASYYTESGLVRDGQWAITKGMCADGKTLYKDSNKTCAVWGYKFGAVLKVTNTSNGRWVLVRVTDRTARRFAETRIDLSRSAFGEIAEYKQGIVPVQIEVIGWDI